MFYQQPPIQYTGTPLKAIVAHGMIWPELADDVPVTDLEVQYFLAKIRCWSLMDMKPKGADFHIDFHGTEGTTFIGESSLIYTLLSAMLSNSMDAGATLFKIDVHDDGNRLRFIISDNGHGLDALTKRLVLRESCTQKAMASGLSLLHAALNVKKIAGEVTYLGKGLDGVGASFSVSFLKQMPQGD